MANQKTFNAKFSSNEYEYLALTNDANVKVPVSWLLVSGVPSMGMDPDIEKAREWLELAVESEDSMEAKALLGRILLLLGDEETALRYLDQVIDNDDQGKDNNNAKSHALRTLGAYYMYRRHDPVQAFPLLEQSALLENDEAKFDLALLRLFGLGGVRGVVRARDSLSHVLTRISTVSPECQLYHSFISNTNARTQVPKSLRRAMRWLKSASSKHRMSLFVLTSLRLVGMGNSNQHRLTCDSAVRSMKRLAEENPWTIRGLFEARQRYIDGDTIGSLSLYLQIAYTGVEVAQANAAHILTKPARGLASWIAETATMFTSENDDDDDVKNVEEEQQQHGVIIPSSSNARNEIAHDLYTSANRQGWKGAVPYICDIDSKSPEDFFSCHSRAVDEARDPHSAFRVGT